MAPIMAFSDKASGMGIEVHIISAATTHNELLFKLNYLLIIWSI